MSARSAKPPVCLHEPIIRQGIEAAFRLVRGRQYEMLAYRVGEAVCDHHVPRRAWCQKCDLAAVDRAHELLDRGALDSDDCYGARVSEMQATISGLTDVVVNLRGSLRVAEAARDAALRRERSGCEHGYSLSVPCRQCSSLVRDLS